VRRIVLALLVACGGGSSSTAAAPECTDAYPDDPGALPDVELDGLDGKKVALHDFHTCAATAKPLVIRVGAAWCGTCRWHAEHTRDLGDAELVDVLVADEDNAPPAIAALERWRDRSDAPRTLALDPENHFAKTRLALPVYLVVDRKTMKVTRTRGDSEIGSVLGERAAPLHDGRFGDEQWDLLHGMVLPEAPPPDPTNAKADDAAAAALGKKLFSDAALSPSGKVSCASCHDSAKDLGDGLPQSTGGIGMVERNAPALTFAAYSRWQFWDGRADALWVQALGPLENTNEFGSSRLFVVHVIADKYKSDFEAAWGPMPDVSALPAAGKPGGSEWASMSADNQKAVTRVYVDAGKSIAAFERTFRAKKNALDAYLAGDAGALTDPEKDGLAAFFASGCAQCHYGPRLTDDAFHVVRFPTGKKDGLPDRGRVDGVALLIAAEITATSDWSDQKPARDPLVPAASLVGAFKTPALRGVAGSAPYGHGGALATLSDVVANHAAAGLPAESTLASGTVEPWLPPIEDAQRRSLTTFLQSLTAEPIVP